MSTWTGKSNDPDKSFDAMLAAKGAADEARFEVARRFTEASKSVGTGGGSVGRLECVEDVTPLHASCSGRRLMRGA